MITDTWTVTDKKHTQKLWKLQVGKLYASHLSFNFAIHKSALELLLILTKLIISAGIIKPITKYFNFQNMTNKFYFTNIKTIYFKRFMYYV